MRDMETKLLHSALVQETFFQAHIWFYRGCRGHLAWIVVALPSPPVIGIYLRVSAVYLDQKVHKFDPEKNVKLTAFSQF